MLFIVIIIPVVISLIIVIIIIIIIIAVCVTVLVFVVYKRNRNSKIIVILINYYSLFNFTGATSSKHISTEPNAAYEDINKFNINVNPAYGEVRGTTTVQEQHVTYEEVNF